MEDIYKKIAQARTPRVHITYDVETEGAQVQKELPFIVGVLGDFSADATRPPRVLRDRKFTEIDADNFNQVMSSMDIGLNLEVNNIIKNDGSQIPVNLSFNTMADFEPAQIVKQVPILAELLEIRTQLRDLLTKVDRSEDLGDVLETVLLDNEQLKTFCMQLGVPATDPNNN